MEEVISFLWKKVVRKVVGVAQDEICKVASVEDELDNLKQKLELIQPFLRDAHNKQFASKEVKDWITRLNEVAYDAHDVIDLHQIQCRDMPTVPKPTKVRKLLTSLSSLQTYSQIARGIADKIKEINGRLDVLYKEKDLFGLALMLDEACPSEESSGFLREERQTTSAITEPSMIGREEDEELVVKWLVQEPNPRENEEGASVIAITGMGGIGKTALAKKIYNNGSVRDCFEKRMWVCVSERPNPLDLFRKILEEVGGKDDGFNQLIGLNALHSEISNHLKDRKFLLVLDDVWEFGWWQELGSLWKGGTSGSKVMITTRQTKVEGLDFTHLHQLTFLTEKQSWQLFVDRALRRGEVEQDLDGVRDVGRDIVNKCGGLPLALNAVGSMLRQKERRRPVWQNILNSPLWKWRGPQNNNDVFAAIALSYMNISFPLRQCLIHCCSFPKDYEMKKESLVRLWLAEGFIPEEKGIDMEVLAERYLEDLVGCSLLQTVASDTKVAVYALHDIVHDFALFIRGEEHVSVDLLKTGIVSPQARVFSSVGADCVLEILIKHNKLRALIMLQIDFFPVSNFLAFKQLRILDLSSSNILDLPESIGDLVLLKYINLSQTKILELPESITKLYDLQTLDLTNSDVQRLPDRISSLGALRHLDLRGTFLLKYLPKGIGKLTCLRTLNKFVVGSNLGDGRGSKLWELHDLNSLRGHLTIEHLERVDNIEESKQAQLSRKENLQSLMLFSESTSSPEKVELLYEELQPPEGLIELSIICYAGVNFPTWMSSKIYYCLEEITFCDCKFLESLPSLGHLPNLLRLEISGAERVKDFDVTSNHVGGRAVFPKLEKLKLIDMLSLEEFLFDAGIETMPCLRWLKVSFCPKLRVLPFFPALEELSIRGVEEWKGWAIKKDVEMPCLKRMDIDGRPRSNLKCLPNCPSLEDMTISHCHQLAELPHSRFVERLSIQNCYRACLMLDSTFKMEKLKHLEIINSPKLAPLLEGIQDMKELKSLVVCGMSKLQQSLNKSPLDLHKLESVRIEDCHKLVSLPHGLHLNRMKKLALKDLPQLTSLPSMLLDNMKALEVLELGPNIHFIEGHGLLQNLNFSRLRCLKIFGFHELGTEWLRCKMKNMDQLEELVIEDCPKLVSISDVLKHHSLPKLRIMHIACLSSYRVHTRQWRRSLTCSLVMNSFRMGNQLSGLVNLSSRLDALIINLFPGLDSLPDWIQQLHQLEYLVIEDSENLTHLPNWLSKLTKLKRFRLTRLPELSSLPDAVGSLRQLEGLYIHSCPKLNFLPNGVQHLSRLHYLYISDCNALVERCQKEDRHKISHIPDLFLV